MAVHGLVSQLNLQALHDVHHTSFLPVSFTRSDLESALNVCFFDFKSCPSHIAIWLRLENGDARNVSRGATVTERELGYVGYGTLTCNAFLQFQWSVAGCIQCSESLLP